MIIIDLSCLDEHRFEAWFRSADDFVDQQARGLVSCPHCGTTEVRRLPSASHIATGATAPKQVSAAASAPAPLALLKAAVDHMLATAENVGSAFPEEARRIHYQESEARPIRGEASVDECEALREEGIDVLRLPMLKPTDLN